MRSRAASILMVQDMVAGLAGGEVDKLAETQCMNWHDKVRLPANGSTGRLWRPQPCAVPKSRRAEGARVYLLDISSAPQPAAGA